jgi:hypothetical protein
MVTMERIATQIAALLGRHPSDGWAVLRAAREEHLLLTNNVGQGTADTPHAVWLLLALVWRQAVRDSLFLARDICALSFGHGFRSFLGAQSGVWPMPDDQTARLRQGTFGDLIATLIDWHRCGCPAEVLDRSATPLHHLTFGLREGVPFAELEFRATRLNEDGHQVVDTYFYGDPIPNPRDGYFAFLNADRLADIAKILGPLGVASGGGGLRLVRPRAIDEDAENDGEIEIAAAGTEERPAAEQIH